MDFVFDDHGTTRDITLLPETVTVSSDGDMQSTLDHKTPQFHMMHTCIYRDGYM
jgi:hypothetical protein